MGGAIFGEALESEVVDAQDKRGVLWFVVPEARGANFLTSWLKAMMPASLGPRAPFCQQLGCHAGDAPRLGGNPRGAKTVVAVVKTKVAGACFCI